MLRASVEMLRVSPGIVSMIRFMQASFHRTALCTRDRYDLFRPSSCPSIHHSFSPSILCVTRRTPSFSDDSTIWSIVSRTMHSQPRKARFKLTSRFSFGIHWRPSLYCMFKSMSKRQQNYVYGDFVSVSLKSCGKLLQACLQLAVLRRLHQDKFALRTTTGGFLNRSPELGFLP